MNQKHRVTANLLFRMVRMTFFGWLALWLTIGLQAQVTVESPGATVAGKTIGEWSAAWWQWAVALAPPGDPFTDSTGQFANVNQSGPVFFLAGSPGGSNSRDFEVPFDRYLLVPLLVGEVSQLEIGFDKTQEQVAAAAAAQANLIDSLHATLDGVSMSSTALFTHREVSPAFSFVATAGNLVNVPPGNSGIAIADGYFLMLGPLTPGTHLIRYGAGLSAYGIAIDETDTITAIGPPPVITQQPSDQAVFTGSNATFNVAASTPNPPLQYQWQFNGVDIVRATNTTLTVSNAQVAKIGDYQVKVSDRVGSTNSSKARLTLIDLPPAIMSQPSDVSVVLGSKAIFEIIVDGAGLSYQWRLNLADLTGATNSTLVISNTQFSDMGNYQVVVTSNYGAVTSSIAKLQLLGWLRTHQNPPNGSASIRGMALDRSGNVVVTGYLTDGRNSDYYTAKYAGTDGAILWERYYTNGIAAAVAVDAAGDVIVTGSSGSFDYHDGPSDYLTLKYAGTDGTLLWERRYNNALNGNDDAAAVAVDGQDNVIVTGISSAAGKMLPSVTIKYSADGTGTWTNTGPAQGSVVQAMALDAGGNVAVTGYFWNGSSDDGYAGKYSAADGSVLWEQRYAGPGMDRFYAVAFDSKGNVVTTGNTSRSTASGCSTVKYAGANGTLLWETFYQGDSNRGQGVTVDRNDNVFIVASSYSNGNSDYYTAKYVGTNGALLWSQSYNGPADNYDDPWTLAIDRNGNLAVSGYSFNTNGTSDYYTTRYATETGAVLWDYRFHNGGLSSLFLAFDPESNLILAGATQNNEYLTMKILLSAADAPVYGFNSVEFTNATIQLSWDSIPGLVLQRTSSLSPPDWQTVTGSINTNWITTPTTGASGYFRLTRQ